MTAGQDAGRVWRRVRSSGLVMSFPKYLPLREQILLSPAALG